MAMRFLVVAMSILGSSSVPQSSSVEEGNGLSSQPQKVCCSIDREESTEATEEVCLSSSVSGLESMIRKNGRACCSLVDDNQPTNPFLPTDPFPPTNSTNHPTNQRPKPTTTTKAPTTTTTARPLDELPCEGVLVIAGDSYKGRLSSVEVRPYPTIQHPTISNHSIPYHTVPYHTIKNLIKN